MYETRAAQQVRGHASPPDAVDGVHVRRPGPAVLLYGAIINSYI